MDDNTSKKRTTLNDIIFDNFSLKKSKPEPRPESPNQHPPLDYLLNDDVVFANFSVDEDELSKLLLDNPACPISTSTFPAPCPVKFVSYPYVSPPVEFSTSYVTINGNEETCGSSFSDTDSSFMVSFDTANVAVTDPFALWSSACDGGIVSGGDLDWNELLFGDDLGKQIN